MKNAITRAASTRLSRRSDELRNLLLKVSLHVLQQGELEPILTHICRELVRVIGAELVVLRLHGTETSSGPAAVAAAGPGADGLVLDMTAADETVGSLSLRPAPGARFSGAAAGELAHFVQELAPVLVAALRQERLLHQATHDALTGLPNRRLWEEAMQRTSAGVLLLIDVDSFKQVNDTLGHPVGDQLLVELAVRMKRALRKGDLLARLGGDEFAVLLPDVTAADARVVAERLRREVAGIRLETGGLTFAPTVSVGMAPVESYGDWNAAVRDADLALYQAKHQGKNCTAAMH